MHQIKAKFEKEYIEEEEKSINPTKETPEPLFMTTISKKNLDDLPINIV